MSEVDGRESICANCEKTGATIRFVTRTYGQGSDLLVIEHIPQVSCPACGLVYFTAETMHSIERIKRERSTAAVVKPVPVAEFAA